jgi:small-conductance mechanosensitive channel
MKGLAAGTGCVRDLALAPKGAPPMDIGDSFQNATDTFFGFLPNLLGFVVLLVIGYIVAKVVYGLLRKLLQKAGLDRHLQSSDANKYVDRVMPGASPSNGIARVAFWIVFVFFLFSAIGALKIPALTGFMNDVLAYLPNVIAAILIFVVAAVLAGAVAAGVTKVMGDTPTGKIVATVGPAIVMVIAMFMVLQQLKIAEQIVQIAFAATMGALALGLALAFGLGGRPVAQRLLEDAYSSAQRNKQRVKDDFATGRERAEHEAPAAQQQFGDTGDSDTGYAGSEYTDSGYTNEHDVSETTQSFDGPPRRY